ncbi:hypothetical protein DQM08_08670 [Lactiplantibacillus paraplantarum]|nr:hypothetical protein DQM08_08670 [Lactiplantibacillus paraplantarum]
MQPPLICAVPNPPSLKYESYSKPEEIYFRLRIIQLLSIANKHVSVSDRMANEWHVTRYNWLLPIWILELQSNIKVPLIIL